MSTEFENKVWQAFWHVGNNKDGVDAVVSVVFEEAAKIAEATSEDAPDGGNDNGATRDGWEMACREIAKSIRQRVTAVSWPDAASEAQHQEFRLQNDREWRAKLDRAKAELDGLRKDVRSYEITMQRIAEVDSAAPDMLAALIAAEEELAALRFEGEPEDAIAHVRKLRRAAIAKATS